LTKFSIRSNQIGDAGAASLAEAFKINASLTEFEISGNQIGDAGAAAFAEAIKINASLTQFDIISDDFDDADAADLAEALNVNASVMHIGMASFAASIATTLALPIGMWRAVVACPHRVGGVLLWLVGVFAMWHVMAM
jgi:hypothetical protein